ncbi:unnamed protein product [Didymodactylos carnosus]|uniref:Uncharacterized protein n=1 Tax=Didymodactylos carnosus TaxID=1234261 RepID=A0A813WGR7_9BILA|nr:unnamed protein product [Didymodactylos carnosus]CAF1212094.1 unnamed protein product [Didymodactylos carnosus]CAF3640981.1 unnamed protein product [Didymodactylos carnosus]CAF4021032.1 unnamed protein product [Didymodactylos carnosus]
MSQSRYDVLSLLVRNVLLSNSKQFQLHGDKQIIIQILPTAPERAFLSTDCYDSSNDLNSISYIDILQRLLRLGFHIESSTSGSYNMVQTKQDKKVDQMQQQQQQDSYVLQYTLVRTHTS